MASESRIRDTDMAAEMMALTKQQILQQSGATMMLFANQSTARVLDLLK
jgi:flagellin